MQKRLWLFVQILMVMMVLIAGCKDSATDPAEEDIKVLVISNAPLVNAWIDTNFTKNIEAIKISHVDVTEDTISSEDLKDFDLVLLYEDDLFVNSVSVGNILYQYVMSGGDLLIGTFYWQDRSSEGFGGSWGDLEMIEPLYGGSCRYVVDSLGTKIDHPLTNGVNSLKAYYRGGPNTLRANATAVAWWSNEDILIAFNKPKGTITMVTTYPGENYYYEIRGFPPDSVGGDFYRLWKNAIKWTAQNTIAAQPITKNSLNKTTVVQSADYKKDKLTTGARYIK